MEISVIIHAVSLLLAVLVTVILLFNIRRNPFINVFILFIILSNLIRIPFYLTYSLGWQTSFPDIPKPFSILFLSNTLFFFQYVKTMLHQAKVDWKGIYLPLVVPAVLFLINLFMPIENTFQVILRGINFPVVVSYVLFFVYQTFMELRKFMWSKSDKSLRFSNYRLIRNWLTALFILYVLLALRLIGSYTYELFTQKMFINMAFQPIHSLLWIFIYIVFFIHPEILYGLQRVQILSNSSPNDQDEQIKPAFKWRTIPRLITNKMDIQLSIKLDHKVSELIKKLESKSALRSIVKDPTINIDSLSDKLNLPKSHIQYVFKYYADFSFVSYRSKIRVFYAISKMKEDFLSKNTMDALARECGFSSYNPFYAAFKAEMGVGPSEVLAQLKQGLNQSQEL